MAADPVGRRDRRVRTRPDTAAGASNCPANVVNTAAIEDCVVDMVTSAAGRAFRRPVRRDLVPSCSHRAACAADAAVASDNLELPCRPAVAAAVAEVDPAGDHRKEDDSGTQLSNDPAAAAAGLDYYYYYLIDSVLAAAVADLELGSDYWRAAVASVNFADQLPAT